MKEMYAAEAQSYDIGSVERIPIGEGRRFRLGAEEIAVFHLRNGEVHAVQAICPHREGPLEDGLTGSGRVVCPLHARAFDLASGEPVGHTCDALRTYPAEVTSAGTIRIYVVQVAESI